MILDSEKAYGLLDDKTKAKYPTYNIFLAKINDINKIITTSISSYVKNDKTYKITGRNGYSMEIIEEYPNDIKISF